MQRVIVVGGGAAGMMAAIRAAELGNKVLLLEKNEKLGKKIYITGKGRCNLTNACDTEELFGNVPRNARFLYSAFYTFSNWQTIAFFEENGLKTKTERGERVFPVSDHSSDVIATLKHRLEKEGVEVRLHTTVAGLLTAEADGQRPIGAVHEAIGDEQPSADAPWKGKQVRGVRLSDGRELTADRVIIATGGVSYPATGSTGDGYRFAKELGHTVTRCIPSLVPFEAAEAWVPELQGLSLKNISVSIYKDSKRLYEGFGEMLFTHFGVSGPLLLSASSLVNDYWNRFPLQLKIDLKPALTEQQLDKRILRDFEENANKSLKNAVQKLFPARLVPVMTALSGIPEEKRVNEITREERAAFVQLIKGLPVTLTGFRDFKEAIITRGGVSVKEVNPSTMESKLVKGLCFAGEVLDLDALTGGFNLQIAWSTGYAAGDSSVRT